MPKEDKQYDVGDEAEVKKRKTKAELRREQEIEDIRRALSNKATRNLIWRILGECGLYRLSFTGNSETFFKEGRRSIGQWLLNELNETDPKIYISLLSDNIEDK
jgi:hypothetical protein